MTKKINEKEVRCSCGKVVVEYDIIRDGVLIHYGYPEVHCHCRCGKKWGTHSDN